MSCSVSSGLAIPPLFFGQDLALILVRRAMDCCFSKRELSLLDDLLPESRKKLDSAKNEGKEEEVRPAGCSGLGCKTACPYHRLSHNGGGWSELQRKRS